MSATVAFNTVVIVALSSSLIVTVPPSRPVAKMKLPSMRSMVPLRRSPCCCRWAKAPDRVSEATREAARAVAVRMRIRLMARPPQGKLSAYKVPRPRKSCKHAELCAAGAGYRLKQRWQHNTSSRVERLSSYRKRKVLQNLPGFDRLLLRAVVHVLRRVGTPPYAAAPSPKTVSAVPQARRAR